MTRAEEGLKSQDPGEENVETIEITVRGKTARITIKKIKEIQEKE